MQTRMRRSPTISWRTEILGKDGPITFIGPVRAVSENLHRTPLPEDLSGKRVAVIADQGLGDQVFFARFLREVGRLGAETVYRPEARLTDMLTRAEIADEVAPEKASLDAEYIVSAADLPFLLGSGSSGLPHPYPIPAHPEQLAKLRDILSDFGPPPWTGVTWRTGTANVRLALSKEIPVEELAGRLERTAGQWRPCGNTLYSRRPVV